MIAVGFISEKAIFAPDVKPCWRERREVIVNSESEEAKNYDFSCADTYLRGNVKFVTFYFECPSCGAVYEIGELKKLEKKQRDK